MSFSLVTDIGTYAIHQNEAGPLYIMPLHFNMVFVSLNSNVTTVLGYCQFIDNTLIVTSPQVGSSGVSRRMDDTKLIAWFQRVFSLDNSC